MAEALNFLMLAFRSRTFSGTASNVALRWRNWSSFFFSSPSLLVYTDASSSECS